MPTHTYPKKANKDNATHEELWEVLCNKPAILSWQQDMPEEAKDVFEKDLRKQGERDYQADYLDIMEGQGDDPPNQSTMDRGEEYVPPEPPPVEGVKINFMKRSDSASPLSTEEGLTVEHKVVERSARELCRSRNSAGPDYVNVPEELFCRSKYSRRKPSPYDHVPLDRRDINGSGNLQRLPRHSQVTHDGLFGIANPMRQKRWLTIMLKCRTKHCFPSVTSTTPRGRARTASTWSRRTWC